VVYISIRPNICVSFTTNAALHFLPLPTSEHEHYILTSCDRNYIVKGLEELLEISSYKSDLISQPAKNPSSKIW
jgi:hypothetical protein